MTPKQANPIQVRSTIVIRVASVPATLKASPPATAKSIGRGRHAAKPESRI